MAALGAVVVACFLAWTAFNRSEGGQTAFLQYVVQADNVPATSVGRWLSSRMESLADTVVPMHLFLTHRDDPFANPIGVRSGAILLFVQYWTCAPFAAGLLFSVVLLAALVRAAVRHPFVVAAVVVVPFLLFLAYWGSFDTGLMREGLQPWLLGVLVLYGWSRAAAPWPGAWERWVLLTRVPETLLMMLLPTIWTQRRILGSGFAATDAAALVAMLAGLAVLGALVWRAASRSARPDRPRPMC